MKNISKESLIYSIVSSVMILLFQKLFKEHRGTATIKEEEFSEKLFSPIYKQFSKVFEHAIVLMTLGASLEEAVKIALLVETNGHVSGEMHPEDHNCDTCEAKGDCPLESTMRDLNKKDATIDMEVYDELLRNFKSFNN